MYITGSAPDFAARLIALPTTQDDLQNLLAEGRSYPAQQASVTLWNPLFAFKWAQIVGTAEFYTGSAF